MIVRLKRLLPILIITGTILPLTSQDIVWYQPDFPPYVIIEGENKDRGIDNQIVASVIPQLLQFEHSYEIANYTRILDNLLLGYTGVITPLFKTPERERFVLYTDRPNYLVLPNGYIYRRSEREKYEKFLTEEGRLDLEALCRNGEFTIGINSGRSYYGILDRTIEKYNRQTPFYNRSAPDQKGILHMVEERRIDGALGFPVEIKYVGLEEELGFFPVSGMVNLIPIYFGAPRTPEGREIIALLNQITEEDQWAEQFTEYYTYWLEEELIPEYDKLRKQFNLSEPAP
ncbi:MAG: transporter substrate-binding domain-containing protein [Spirochaetales bacterium]|nr:transporter substrate-binding domain-containing protein [Spirochaetales bacterium]